MRRLLQLSVAFIAFVAAAPLWAAEVDVGGVKMRLAAVASKTYDADALVVLDLTDVTVLPNGIGESTEQRVVKVLKEGGIKGQAVQRFDFDPTTNRLEVKAVRVYRADGTVEEVPVASATIQPQPQWGIFWASNNVLVGIPRLNVGDSVETVIVKTGFNVAYLGDAPAGGAAAFGATVSELVPPMPGHWYDEVNFWSGLPVAEKRYVVRMPKDKPLMFEVFNGEVRSAQAFDNTHTIYTFEKKDIAPHKGEPKAVSSRDSECKLVLATLDCWKTKSRWFHEKNEPSFEVDDELKAKVAEVVAPCKTDEEKITALNHWVAENIRYVGTSRGACEGYTTHKALETFRDRGGVCKDKAGLLVAMLRVAGFDSYIVMTQAGTDVTPIPADQFNHAVTCIRQADGSFRLLDPTWMPKSRENWSSAEQLQYVVYGTPEGQPLSLSPYSGPEENALLCDAHTALDASGTLTGKMALKAIGAPETSLRRSLAGHTLVERGPIVAGWFMRLANNIAPRGGSLTDPVDFSGPFVIESEFSVPGYAIGDGERRFFRLPMLRRVLDDVVASDLHDTTGLEKRKTPLRLRSTRRLEFRETLQLPPGWAVAEAPEAKSIDGPAARLDFSISRSAGQIEYACVLDVKQRTIAPADYANFKQALEAFREICDKYVVCRMEPRAAQR